MAVSDASVMSALTPTHKVGVEWPYLKNSPVYHGSHTLRLRQPSRDPAYNRAYAPGDPVNLVDWKAFVRTDQLIIRQTRHEASARILIVIDTSPSMFWPDHGITQALGQPLPSKFQIALRIAANLGYAHAKLGDQVTFVLMNESSTEKYQKLQGIRSCQDVARLFAQAEAANFASERWHEGIGLAPYVLSPADVVVVATDALESTYQDVFLKCTGHVRWLVHVLSNLETNSTWLKGAVSYFEAEESNREFQGVELVNDAVLTDEVEAWLERIDAEAKAQHFAHVLFTDQSSLSSYENWLHHAMGGR